MGLSKVLMDACIRKDKSQWHHCHWLRPISMIKVMMDACIQLRIKATITSVLRPIVTALACIRQDKSQCRHWLR